jgi:Flp pilus assembly protein TadD
VAATHLGELKWITGDYAAATDYLTRALGSRPGEAETLNNLAELACRTGDTDAARKHNAQALAVAREFCLSPEEARALEGLGQAHLQDGDHDQGREYLRQARAIYRRMGAPTPLE